MRFKSFGSPIAFVATICVSLVFVFGCATSTPDSTPDDQTLTGLDSLGAGIDQFIVDKQASGIESCRLIAFGSKPCGGPWRYLVYSTEAADSVELTALVTEYNELEAKLNREEERVSDCAMVQRPRMVWEDGYCGTDP